MKILHVVGARPNFPKLAPVYRAIGAAGLEQVIVHTGQHYDDAMSDAFFRDLGVRPPDVNLEVGSGTHAAQTARIMERIEPVLLSHRPDWIVVYGDVNSTAAAALVAVKIGQRVAHVEAGVRSHDWAMPEEVNRVVVDRLAELLLAPSRTAEATLRAEGEPDDEIVFVGNVMVDALRHAVDRARSTRFRHTIGMEDHAAVVTLHRPSNVDDPTRLASIVLALRTIATRRTVVFPVHPRTQARISSAGLDMSGIRVLAPVGYLEMLDLVDAAGVLITDSGGLQVESAALGVPCVTVRDTTEWPETIACGANRLVFDPVLLPPAVDAARRLLSPPRPEGVGWNSFDAHRRGVAEALLMRSPMQEGRGPTLQLLHVVGARPNLPKLAPVYRAAACRGLVQTVVHTGQHYDDALSAAFFRDLDLPTPDINLEVGSHSHAVQTARVMERLEPVIDAQRPDWVVVYGDVNSTLAAALVAAKLGVRTAHVEAGLRSGDRRMPEEINRIVADRLGSLLLAPSRDAEATLRGEGESADEIVFVGNVMIDSVLHALPRARKAKCPWRALETRPVVVTLHRPSNVDDPARLAALGGALSALATKGPVVFPVHPRTRERLRASGVSLPGVTTVDPLAYDEMLALVDIAHAVITDSGGLQEETTVLGVPCFTVRETTERPITVTEGTNTMVWDPARLPLLVANAKRTNPVAPEGWDGGAAVRIVEALLARQRDPSSAGR